MWTDPTWMQMGLDALRATVDVDTALKHDMVEFLLAEGLWDRERLAWDSAVARFNACCNPAKHDYFKVSEIWALMKRFEKHDLFLAMAADLGYEVRRRPTEERRQQLLERLAVAFERCGLERDAVQHELERLDTTQRTRLDPAIASGLGKFSIIAAPEDLPPWPTILHTDAAGPKNPGSF